MRYEFDRDGTVVASVLWEGPGQVSVESAEPSTRAVVDRYLASDVVYLGSGFDFGADQEQDVLQMRRRDWAHYALGLNAMNCRLLRGRADACYAEAFFVVPLEEYVTIAARYDSSASHQR